MNDGKRFEEDFRKSIPDDMFCMRIVDAGGWSNATNTRFTGKNICDYILFTNSKLFLLELKSHKGRSIPQTTLTQLGELSKVNYKGVYPLFVLNFRDHEQTYLISPDMVNICLSGRKSVPMDFCMKHGTRLPQTRLRVRFRYDMDTFKEGFEMKCDTCTHNLFGICYNTKSDKLGCLADQRKCSDYEEELEHDVH